MKAEGVVNAAVGEVFALNKDKAAQAFLGQVKLLKDIDALVKMQIALVKAANTTLYSLNIAKHLESVQGIFSQQDKDNKSLSEKLKVQLEGIIGSSKLEEVNLLEVRAMDITSLGLICLFLFQKGLLTK